MRDMQNEGMVRRDVVVRIERLIGVRVESYMPVVGGYTAAMRLLCSTTRTRFFAKIGTTPLTCQCLRREMHVYNCISGAFMPLETALPWAARALDLPPPGMRRGV
jgi:hypothetical protein